MSPARKNVGQTPGRLVDPLLAYLHRVGLGRAYTEAEIIEHLRAFAMQVDAETREASGVYRMVVAQMLDLYGSSLRSTALVARSRALGESVRTMRALGLMPKAPKVGGSRGLATGGRQRRTPALSPTLIRQTDDEPEVVEPDNAAGAAGGAEA